MRGAAGNAGARAWVFAADDTGDRFVEFIEWQADAQHNVLGLPDVAGAIEELNAAFPAQDSETWVEAKI